MNERRDTQPRDDGAVFAPARIRSTRRPPLVAAALALTIGGLAAIGAIEGFRGEPRSAEPTASAVAVAQATRTARPSRPPVASPPVTPGSPSILALDLRPAGSHLFVHGDVFSLGVVVVIVSIEDAAGHASAIRSVRLQDGSTALRIGANARFDIRFDIPDEVMGEGLWVQANAYDRVGRRIESYRQLVVRPLLDA